MQQFWRQMYEARMVAGEQHWLTREEEELQMGHSERFQTPDSIAEQIGEEVRKRDAHRDTYPLECSLSAGGVAKLFSLRWDDLVTVRRVAYGLRKHLGDKKDLRSRDGNDKSWKFWLNRNEQEALRRSY